jgi:molybdopterin synthase catalytic subunit
MGFIDIKITSEALARSELPQSRSDGAVIVFFGVVRQYEKGKLIAGIDYEAYVAMAESQMRVIAQKAIEKFSVNEVTLYHRIGYVPVGESSLYLRVQAPHRGPAFEACQLVIEQLKAQVPIWKHVISPKSKVRSLES